MDPTFAKGWRVVFQGYSFCLLIVYCLAAFSSMVTGSEGQLHNHDSANRDPTFVQCLGTRDVAMRAGASHIGVDKPVAENAVKQ